MSKQEEKIGATELLYILNNLFEKPIITLKSLSEPSILVSLCCEMSQDFEFIQHNISISNTYGIIYSDLSDIIQQMKKDIVAFTGKDAIEQLNIDLVQLLSYKEAELIKIAKMILVYAFTCDKKEDYKKKKEALTDYDYVIYIVVKKYGYGSNIIERKVCEENSDEASVLSKKKDKKIKEITDELSHLKAEFKEYKEKKEEEISRLNEIINNLQQNIRREKERKILFKDYNELKEKSRLYDKLLTDLEKNRENLNNISKERETSYETFRSSSQTNQTELSEQDYLSIIAKKDYEIMSLQASNKLLENKNNGC